MLFHSCGDRNLNLDLTASLPFAQSTYFSRRTTGLFKDPCKIISKFVDFDEPTESDRYIGDLSIDEDLEKEIEVGFFDALKTPSEELKGFTPIDESNPLVSGLIAAVVAANNALDSPQQVEPLSKSNKSFAVPSASSSLPSSSTSSPFNTPSPSPPLPSSRSTVVSISSQPDIEMEGRKPGSHLPAHLSHLQVKQTPGATDSLMTPIIDPNSSLSSSGPHFPSFDVNSDNVFGQYLQELTQQVSCGADNHQPQQLQAQDIKPNFSLTESTLSYTTTDRHDEPSALSAHSSSSSSLHLLHQQSSTESNLTGDRSSSHLYSLGSSTTTATQQQPDFDYPTTIPGISGYSARSTICGVDPSTIGMEQSPSLTPSSSTSSMSYAELKPRSYSFSHSQPSTSDNLVPTVVEDHPYTSRNNSSSSNLFGGNPSFSPPSSCPSTSSLASTSDQKEATRDLFNLINEDLVNRKRQTSHHHHHHHSDQSSRRGRLTKKEKLDKMVSEEKRLENENSMLKEQLRVMEHQFKVLQTKITNILIDAAKRKG